MSSNRGHRAGQCAPEVARTRIRSRGDLQERRPQPSYSHIQHTSPAPLPGGSLITIGYLHHGHAAASSPIGYLHPARRQPHSAEIRRWRRQSVRMSRKICVCLSSSPMWQQRRMRIYIIRCGKGRITMLRVSKSGLGAPDC